MIYESPQMIVETFKWTHGSFKFWIYYFVSNWVYKTIVYKPHIQNPGIVRRRRSKPMKPFLISISASAGGSHCPEFSFFEIKYFTISKNEIPGRQWRDSSSQVCNNTKHFFEYAPLWISRAAVYLTLRKRESEEGGTTWFTWTIYDRIMYAVLVLD